MFNTPEHVPSLLVLNSIEDTGAIYRTTFFTKFYTQIGNLSISNITNSYHPVDFIMDFIIKYGYQIQYVNNFGKIFLISIISTVFTVVPNNTV